MLLALPSIRWTRTRRTAGVLAAMMLVLAGLVAVPASPARAAVVADLPVTLGAPSSILAGEDGSFTVEVRNEGGDRFNLGLVVAVPTGLTPREVTTLRGEPLGGPRVIAPGGLGSGQPPTGTHLWVWEDVSDLPAGAMSGLVVAFEPDPTIFPVGSTIDLEAAVHASTDARYRPVFPGSTGVGGSAAESATASSTAAEAQVQVSALRLEKDQLTYAENELLRGVHEQGAIYRLRVTNTDQGPTVSQGVVNLQVVDWLPAGLEFLGCGGVDHSTHDWSGEGDGEYTGAGVLGAGQSATDPCPAPDSVETVLADADDAERYDVVAGRVYTRVTWSLANLGSGDSREIHYVAAVPLRENTLSWDLAPDGQAPSATSGEQGANLDNNTGSSTRHGSSSSAEDGDAWTNAARAQGHYTGPVAPGTDRLVWDDDAETITAMDLAVVKDVDRGDFAHGQYATYTLTVSTSEYASSSDITVTDTIPDGMCLVAPPSATECATSGSFGPWDVEDVVLNGDGSRTVTFRYAPGTLEPNASIELVYPVLMGVAYDETGQGPTTSGDRFTNTVEIEGTTTLEPGVADRLDGQGPWRVWDDSSAGLSAPHASISKQVLARGALPGGGCEAAAPGDPAWQDAEADDFRLGDTVCYLLTVNFPDVVDTRNPTVTDVVPAGIAYEGWALGSGSPPVSDPTVAGDALSWLVGAAGSGTSDRIVPSEATLHLYVWGTVTTQAVGAVVDKPENLMKYRQENVAGEVFYLREQASSGVLQAPLSLLKGVHDVDGQSTRPAQTQGASNGTTFGSNRDGIQIVDDEVIRYRVDLDSDFPVHDVVVWDLLPAVLNGLSQAQIEDRLTVPAGVDVVKASTLGISGGEAQRWALVWEGIEVGTAVGDRYRETLDYSLRATPQMAEVSTSHTNTASIISYAADTNDGGERTYLPADGPSYSGRPPAADRVPTPAGRRTTDPSHVRVENVDVTKVVSSPEGTNNTGPALPASSGTTQVAIGEWATYTYDVTIPASTSVVNGALTDVLPAPASNWEIDVDATTVTYPSGATAPGATSFTHGGATFTVNPATGALTFPTGTYTTAAEETFTVGLTARIRPSSLWAHSTSTNRTNTARFHSSGTPKDSATAHTRLVEPDPRVSKVADDDTIVAEQLVTYTLQAWNSTGRPTSFDTVVTDCVPLGLAVQLPVTAPAGTSVAVDTAAAECAGTLITWTIGDLAAEGSTPAVGELASRQTLEYDVVIDPAAGAGVLYENTARVAGYSVPDDRVDGAQPDPRRNHSRTVTEQVRAINPAIVKTVEGGTSANAVVGEIVDYEVVVTIPVDINLYDTTITDVVPAGLAISDVGVAYGPSWGTPPSATPVVSGQEISLDLGDLLSADEVRTVTLTYRGTVVDGLTASTGASLENTATLAWNGVDGETSTRSTLDDDATVTVREPAVTIDKHVDHPATTPAAQSAIDVDAGGSFHYRVRVANTGTSTAHDVEVVDTVPTGVVVDPATISPLGVLIDADPTTGGGTITWALGSIAAGADRSLTYEASLASSAHLDTSALENLADVTEYFSHPGDPAGEDYDDDERRRYEGPQDDASVTPLFPEPTVTKTVDPAVTALGDAVVFEIVVENEGDSPLATYRVTDELPVGWTVSDATPAPISQSGTAATGLTLVWEGGPIAVDGSATITYEATPDPDHPWTSGDLGMAALKAHVNDVVVRGTDGSGDGEHRHPTTGDPVSYEDSDDAVVNVPLADLALSKSVLTDPDDVVAGDPITWALDVQNLGPDAEVGPVTVTDEIPAGVIADDATDLTVTGSGWSLDSYDEVTRTLVLVHAGGVAAPSVGGPGAIPRVTVTAVVDPGFVPDGSTTRSLANSASVEGVTDELEKDNNEDDASIDVRAVADLEIDKSAVTGSYVPGTFVTWEIDVTNNGPSVSRTPFTVTDTLPAEVDPTSFELLGGTDWSVDGGAPDENVVTFTYAGDDLDVGDATPTLSFRVEVRSDLLTTDPIINEATVNPRTPDEDLANNDDDAPVGHGTSLADLSLVKSLASEDLVAGEGGRYRLEVANDGPSYAVDVLVTDTLPEGLTYAGGLESQPGDTWVLEDEVPNADGTTTLTFSLDSGSGMLPDGEATWLEFDVAVASWVTADVTNVADVSSPTPDPDPDNNEDPETSAPLVRTNVSVTKVHDDAVRRVGDTVVFTIEVTNHGPADADDVTITDALPAGLTFEGLTDVLEPTDGRSWTYTAVDDELLATLDGPLPAGETAVVELTTTLTPESFPEVVNTVAVETTTEETDLDDNVATDPVPVDSPDLRVVKSAEAESVQGGDELTYQIVVTNHGGAHADEVSLTDTLPAELEYLTSVWDESDPAHAIGEVCEVAGADDDGLGGTLDCLLPDGLEAGQSATLVVTLAVPADVAVDSVTNFVAVASDDEDPSLRGDNDDEESTPVRWIQVAAHPVCVLEAPWLDFTVDLHNVSVGEQLVVEWYADADADGVPDGVPVRTETVGTSASDLMSGRVLWPGAEVDDAGLPTLLPGLRPAERGETATWQHLVEDESLPEHALRGDVIVRFTINPETSVSVAYPPPSADCLAARDTALEVTKSADAERVGAGDRLTYTIDVRNTGNGAARDVVMTDLVPAELKVEEVRTAKPESRQHMPWGECTVSGADPRGYGGTVTCELDGVLARGQSAPTITVVTTVDPEAESGDVVNVAQVEWVSGDGDEESGVVEDDAQVEVRGDEELPVTGTEILRLLGLAVVLAMVGAVLVLAVRARRT